MKDLNLIPKSFITEKKNKVKKAYLSVLILCVGFAAVLSYIAPTVYEYNLTNRKESLEQQVNQTNNYVEMENEFNSLKNAVEVREKEGKLLDQKKLDALGLINAIEFAVPEKLFIQNASVTGEAETDLKVSLKGVASGDNEIASFIRNLMDDGYFKTVTLISVLNNQGNNGSSFEISLNGIGKSDLMEYKSWDNGFTVKYPGDWVIKENKEEKLQIAAQKSLSKAKPATLEVLTNKSNLNIKAFVDDRNAQLKKKLNKYEFKYSSPTKSSGVDAYKTMYFSEEDNVRYQYLELCTLKNNKAFIVTYKSDATGFSNKARTIDRILKSFNIN